MPVVFKHTVFCGGAYFRRGWRGRNGDTEYYHLQMPRWLFADGRYKPLALESKVAYTFLLNRFQLSRMNGWINDVGEVFIIFTRQELADEMQISFRKAIECFQELVSAKLIWERRMGRGYRSALVKLQKYRGMF